jgi:hypothetical protein
MKKALTGGGVQVKIAKKKVVIEQGWSLRDFG